MSEFVGCDNLDVSVEFLSLWFSVSILLVWWLDIHVCYFYFFRILLRCRMRKEMINRQWPWEYQETRQHFIIAGLLVIKTPCVILLADICSETVTSKAPSISSLGMANPYTWYFNDSYGFMNCHNLITFIYSKMRLRNICIKIRRSKKIKVKIIEKGNSVNVS